MSDIVCVICAEEHTDIDFGNGRDYPTFIGKCLFCDEIKVGVNYINSLEDTGW